MTTPKKKPAATAPAVDIEQVQEIVSQASKTARNLVTIIDALAKRGSFEGTELHTIGNMRQTAESLSSQCDSYEQQNLK